MRFRSYHRWSGFWRTILENYWRAPTSSTSSDDVPVSFSNDDDVETPDDDDVPVSSSDDDVVEALPDTQKLLGRLVDATHTDTTSDDEEEEDDTQMTTLSVITTLLT